MLPPTCMLPHCQETGCHLCTHSGQHFVCLCVDVPMYCLGSSSVSNEDVWPSVHTTIRLPCYRNAEDFAHSSLSLFFPALPPSICHSLAQLSSVFLDFSCLFLCPLTWNPFFFLSFTLTCFSTPFCALTHSQRQV